MGLISIAVLGAGNGGHAIAADMASRGHDVTLYETPRFKTNLDGVAARGQITMRGVLGEGSYPVRTTTSMDEALMGKGLVFVAVPAFAVDEMVDAMAPHLDEGQAVVFNGSANLASVRLQAALRRAGNPHSIRMGDFSTLTYGCRLTAPGEVTIHLAVNWLLFSAFPSCDTPGMLDDLGALYPSARPGTSVLDCALNNGNPLTHPAPTLLNAGRIEYSGGEFYLYREGITPSVAQVIKTVDRERLALCEALGCTTIPVQKRLVLLGYAEELPELHLQYSRSKVFFPMKGPSDLDSRYLTEDVPYGLVLWSSLGKMAGVPTPTIDALIVLASALKGVDYNREGLTLERLGLGGMDRESVLSLLQQGS